MSERPFPEQHYGAVNGSAQQAMLPLERPGVETIIWHLPYATLIIETRDGVCYVNGSAVEPIDVTVRRHIALSDPPDTCPPPTPETA